MTNSDPTKLSEEGKLAFGNRQYDRAAELFRQSAESFALDRDEVSAAEAKNNLSVALLKAGKSQAALEAALDTDQVFANANDLKRQAMALGNQAAALEALKRYDEALTFYEKSAELFAKIGDGDMQAVVLKSAAAVKLKTGKVASSAYKMMDSLSAKQNPTLFERIMNFFLRMRP